MRSKYLPIGSVSWGTLRPEHIGPALVDASRTVRMTRADRALFRARNSKKYDNNIVCDMMEVLNNYCAPYTYFGALDGDGADFGVWPMIDSIEENMRTGELPSLVDAQKTDTLAVHVSDHGNATLYKRDKNSWREVWSTV